MPAGSGRRLQHEAGTSAWCATGRHRRSSTATMALGRSGDEPRGRDRNPEGVHIRHRLGQMRSSRCTRSRPRSMPRMPLAHDMIGLYFAVGNANHLPPWGGLDMLLSTNPIAAAIPAGERAADRARYGDHGCGLWQGQDQGAARRDHAGGLDDRSRGQAARPIPSAPTKACCCRSAAWRPATRATASP